MRPYPPKSFGMGSFNSIESEREDTQAGKVYTSAPKQSLMTTRGDFSPSFLRDLKENTSRATPLQLSKTHTKTLSGGNQITWLQSKLSNMAIQGALGKPHLLRQPFRQDRQQNPSGSGAKRPGQSLHSVFSTPVKKLELGGPSRIRDGASFTLPQAELMVGRNIALGHHVSKVSRVFNQQGLLNPNVSAKKKTVSAEDLFKIYVKIQLKDTINFRYSCKWLGNLSAASHSEDSPQLVDQLAAVTRYLRTAGMLMKPLTQMLDEVSKRELLSKIKMELDHERCLHMLYNFLKRMPNRPAKPSPGNSLAEELHTTAEQLSKALFGAMDLEPEETPASKRRVLGSDIMSRGSRTMGALVRPQNYQKLDVATQTYRNQKIKRLDVEDSDSLDPGDGPAKNAPVLPQKTSRTQVAEEEPSNLRII